LRAVGMTTDYELHGPDFDSRFMQEALSKTSRTTLESTQPPIQWVPAFFLALKATRSRCWPLTKI